MGVRIRGTLGDIDPLNQVLFQRARSRVKKGPLLRGLPNTTSDIATNPCGLLGGLRLKVLLPGQEAQKQGPGFRV